MYQLLIFDWDGTIMDSAHKIATCLRKAAVEVGLEPPSMPQAKNVIGLGLLEAIRRLFPEASETQSLKMVDAYKHMFVTADQTSQDYFDGVEDGLRCLYETGVFMAVATGKSRVGLDRAFTTSRIKDYFVTSRCADETRSKPHPQMLHEILDFTAIDVNKAIMIGDTSFDLDMAAAANMHGLGVSYGVHNSDTLKRSGAIDIVDDFSGLVSWFVADDRLEAPFS